ncbi:MAG TPA: hypothetical protein VMH27_03065 [Puia sp.]|nr:hypothetical protein [Puia sp.]
MEITTILRHFRMRAVTSIGVLSITLVTVSAQSIKAALANPVTSLRQE